MEGDGGEELCIWDIYSWGFEAWRPSRPPLLKYTPGGYVSQYVSQYVSHTSLSPVTPSIFVKVPSKFPKKYLKLPKKSPKNPQNPL